MSEEPRDAEPTDRVARDFQWLVAASADMTTVATAEGIYRYISPACRWMLGWDPEDLEGHHQDEFVHPDDVPALRAARESAPPADDVSGATHRFRCADGSYRWIEARIRRVDSGDGVFLVATVRDIAERQKSDLRLQRQASTDPLTGVANRTVLMDRLQQALRRQGRGKGLLAVLFLDLDRFKVINDSLGHRIGDRVLHAMAERLVRFLRASDTLARLGGDEFVVVAEDMADEGTAVELGNRITEAGRRPFRVGEEEFVCTVSVGIATTADPHHSPEGLLQEADLALYRAKDRGRDRAELFDEDLRSRAVGRLGTERMLRRAIEEQRLGLEYQPIVDLASDRIVSAEALVRVFDPATGLMQQPDAFLEVAEETGLLTVIDDWVFAEAVRQASEWHARLGASGFSGVAVNVTTRHLADATFAKDVIDSVDANHLPRDHLQVEVTERVLIEAANSAMSGLRALREAGVQVGLDDFGIGYSSLAYLRHFPLNFVKIDRSFITGMVPGSSEEAIVAAIVGLSHALGLSVVAEGVETEDQLRSLQVLGCDRAQGFLFARPGPADVVAERVEAEARAAAD